MFGSKRFLISANFVEMRETNDVRKNGSVLRGGLTSKDEPRGQKEKMERDQKEKM